ncbi:TM2 domain-containing protein [Paractinoplanes ferrugineus]|uniref:TM2 domain-containing protein n=1 Tax=Paractinoplanes ferrugineus TaxID=113564 RepID=UPI001EF341A9|nr:TM2 domain-containing protein [Actinoplanes ferrugineus]
MWVFLGLFGGHRFYLGDTGRSVAMLFTLGGLGVWTLVDGLLVGRRVTAVNRRRREAIMARYGILDAPDPLPSSHDGSGTSADHRVGGRRQARARLLPGRSRPEREGHRR